MKKIKGIAIDELEDLDFNLSKLRRELNGKTSFWSFYNAAVSSHEEEKGISKASRLFKTILFISLIPMYIKLFFFSVNTEELIDKAELELIEYYKQPKTKVRRFRLKCQNEKALYKTEIELIENELKVHRKNIELNSVGVKTKKEIQELIDAFENKKSKKLNKYNFYQECEQKLIDIEEQIQVRQSIEKSKKKLEQLRERKVEKSKHNDIEKEFELYEYYGNLLDSISLNMKKIELDKEEKIEGLELKEMIDQIELKE